MPVEIRKKRAFERQKNTKMDKFELSIVPRGLGRVAFREEYFCGPLTEILAIL